MKKGAIDQILLWLTLFTIFASFLFFIIDYSIAIRIKDNADALSDYAARMVALGKSNDEIATGLNTVKLGSMTDIIADDIVCIDDITVNHQVQFTVLATFSSKFFGSDANNVQSKAVVFNEVGDTERACTLNITFK